MTKKANHLIHETSPYLLQHAHNPVNWYPWGDEALSRARNENKPILVSIGYAACHWCHVMERESFEDEKTAAIMNNHFINIKIDREERPDLDHIYMDAVQAMTGSGGWPLNVFLTPDAKPFYGGTYFPPKPAYNRPSWIDTLEGVAKAFSERRHEIDAQADNLTDHLLQSNGFGMQKMPEDEVVSEQKLNTIYENIMKMADREWGGFGKAPKFPQTFSIQFLLRHYHFTKDEAALKQALLSLDRMIDGGIYDQIGGGFARYSTDTEWLAPHFEKMLYDNALLVSLLAEAYQLTHIARYREVLEETMDFIQREMLDEGGGFYSALDADSEGVEGKFYVWTKAEVEALLGEEAGVFCSYYDITESGNWEHRNILRVKTALEKFATERQLDLETVRGIIQRGKERLLLARSSRIRPMLDDKIILGWNALMNLACSNAFAATGSEEYRALAERNMNFLLSAFEKEGNECYHTWKNGIAKYPAFLDDYAFLIAALLRLQEITVGTNWLKKAVTLTEYVIDNFSEAGTGFFFYTASGQDDVIIRKKEVYDGAVPSGNSTMAYCLHHLSILFDRPEWKARANDMLLSLGKAIINYPTSFGNWAALLQELVQGTNEITLLGKELTTVHVSLLAAYVPHRVMMVADKTEDAFPLMTGKEISARPVLWLCRNYTCLPPVFSVNELISLIDRAPGG